MRMNVLKIQLCQKPQALVAAGRPVIITSPCKNCGYLSLSCHSTEQKRASCNWNQMVFVLRTMLGQICCNKRGGSMLLREYISLIVMTNKDGLIPH